jgi:hypothetical protein
MLQPRIIKNKDCPICAAYMKRLDKLSIKYITLDTTEEDSKQLDAWKITNMPIVQIIDENKKVLWQFPFSPGGISPRAINYKIQELSKGD